MKNFKENLTAMLSYMKGFLKWLIIAVVTGTICGVVGAVFHMGIDHATELRGHNPWILYFLPLGGIIIVFLYKISKMWENGGTNNVINAVKEKEQVPWKLAPLIFISTIITHLLGGSSGREGAALQLGGSIGSGTAKLFRQGEKNRNIVIMCGMSGVFAALFGTPITAAVFSLEVISVGVMYYGGLVPAMISAVTANIVAGLFGVGATHFTIANIPGLEPTMLIRVIVLAVLAAVVSIIFCVVMENTAKGLKRFFKNDYLRAVIGAVMIIILTLIVGSQDYNGAGMNIVEKAISGEARWFDFILKLIFTAITIGAGFKGGEIVPTFFVGATFGCVAGGLLGIDPGFAASLGLIALFSGVVNCPLAAFILAIEIFGGEGAVYYALASGIGYMMSGYYGLYSSQNIVYSKLKAEYINRKTH